MRTQIQIFTLRNLLQPVWERESFQCKLIQSNPLVNGQRFYHPYCFKTLCLRFCEMEVNSIIYVPGGIVQI
jgi:hypothetical protein